MGLRVREAVQAVFAHPVFSFQPVRAVVVGVDHAAIGARAGEHFTHELAVPRLGHEFGFGHWRRRRIADDGNELVNVRQRHRQAFKHVSAFARLAQGEDGAAGDDLAAVLQKDLDEVFQVAQLGLPIDERHHVDAKGVLQLRLFVQVVQHHFGHFAALEFDYQAHA